jgi:hypothetical protein
MVAPPAATAPPTPPTAAAATVVLVAVATGRKSAAGVRERAEPVGHLLLVLLQQTLQVARHKHIVAVEKGDCSARVARTPLRHAPNALSASVAIGRPSPQGHPHRAADTVDIVVDLPTHVVVDDMAD